MQSRKLTYRTLLDANACSEQRELFQERFGTDSDAPALDPAVEVTVELAVEQATDWAWSWAAEELLSDAGYEEFHKTEQTALTAYRAVMAPFWKATEDSYKSAEVAYNAVTNAWSDEHPGAELPSVVIAHAIRAWEAIRNPVYKAKDEAQVLHRHALHVILARTFAEIYIREGEDDGRE